MSPVPGLLLQWLSCTSLPCAGLGSEAALVKDSVLLPLFLFCLDDQVVIINAI